MAKNIADMVEEYIRRRLEQNADGQVELKRTALADEINCAPSQISYVLSTRFTAERGFVVESRRGLGGYIRIAILQDEPDEKQLLYRDIIDDIDEETDFDDVKSILEFLMETGGLITPREAELVAQMVLSLYRSERQGILPSQERVKLIRSIFVTLSKIT